MKCYAGIGARNTPTEVLAVMRNSALLLAKDGYICKTGAALGADQAFGNGAGNKLELYLPWPDYEKAWISSLDYPGVSVINAILDRDAFRSVDQYHPAPGKLRPAVRLMHARNYLIVRNVEFVVCWTPEGVVVGGTGQALRIAIAAGTPIYNLGHQPTLDAFSKKIAERNQVPY